VKESLKQMSLGTIIIIAFSDPMVEVLGAMGNVIGVSPF